MAPKRKNNKKEEEKKEEPKAVAPPAKAAAQAAAPPSEGPEAAAAPPAKRAKVEGEAAPAEPAETAEPAEPAEPEEREADAKADKRATLKEAVTFWGPDTTLNVVPAAGDRVLASLSDGGMQYLIAGARASVGISAGRYAFEAKVLEATATADQAWGRGTPKPRQLLRLGFSAAGSPAVLGEHEEHVYFDSEGTFHADKQKVPCSKKFGKGEVLTVVLNLDAKSPNAHTVSLFKEGERIAQPQPIPEKLRGKPLFPHLSYRNVTVQVNFGPHVLHELPFKCRMWGGAAQQDAVVTPNPVPKDGKFDVMLPVGYPDEGTFEWLDMFLAKNPQYVELSDRKILEWAHTSGIWKSKQHWKSSLDKPDYNFNIGGMDDFSIRRVLNAISAVVPRNYVVMEVKANLVPEERKKTLMRFGGPRFKRTARVVMGEPSQEFKDAQMERLLQEKQQKEDAMFRGRLAEKARKKIVQERQKQFEEQRKKIEEQKKAKMEVDDGEKKEDAVKKEGGAEEEAKAEAKDEAKEEAKEEEKEEAKEEGQDPTKEGVKEEAKADVKEEAKEMEVEETEPPKATLTDEEKSLWFRPKTTFDVKESALNQAFASFSLPGKDEGFDSIKFEWEQEAGSTEYLRKKVVEKKRSTKLESIQPGQWFQDKLAAWKKTFAEWQEKLTAFKATAKEQEVGEGDGKADIFTVEDVANVGNNVPLFKEFQMEDWALLQLRYELFLLAAAWKKDVADEDRPGVPEGHLAFYYGRYFKKQLSIKAFGVDTGEEFLKLVKDTASWEDGILALKFSDEERDAGHFVKLAEEARRDRSRRLDAGDETARLKIQPTALAPPAAAAPAAAPAVAPAAPREPHAARGHAQWQQAPKADWQGQGADWQGQRGDWQQRADWQQGSRPDWSQGSRSGSWRGGKGGWTPRRW